MIRLFILGGWPMFIVVGFGLVALVAAALYAIRGKRQPLGFVYGMMGATFFAVLCGFAADLGAVFFALSSDKMSDVPAEQAHRILLEGFGESMSPGIMGFTMLSLTAFLVAVGSHRAARREAS